MVVRSASACQPIAARSQPFYVFALISLIFPRTHSPFTMSRFAQLVAVVHDEQSKDGGSRKTRRCAAAFPAAPDRDALNCLSALFCRHPREMPTSRPMLADAHRCFPLFTISSPLLSNARPAPTPFTPCPVHAPLIIASSEFPPSGCRQRSVMISPCAVRVPSHSC